MWYRPLSVVAVEDLWSIAKSYCWGTVSHAVVPAEVRQRAMPRAPGGAASVPPVPQNTPASILAGFFPGPRVASGIWACIRVSTVGRILSTSQQVAAAGLPQSHGRSGRRTREIQEKERTCSSDPVSCSSTTCVGEGTGSSAYRQIKGCGNLRDDVLNTPLSSSPVTQSRFPLSFRGCSSTVSPDVLLSPRVVLDVRIRMQAKHFGRLYQR
jgi:hypothetical protein